MRPVRWMLGVVAAARLAGVAGEAAATPSCTSPEIIHLLPLRGGRSSSAVDRSDRVNNSGFACYQFRARGGGTLYIKVYSAKEHAFLRLYGPNWTVKRDGASFVFNGTELPGATEADDKSLWKGPSPVGNMLIVVATKGEPARYRLRVEFY